MIILIIIIAIIVSIVYTAILWRYQRPRVWEWLHSFIATVLSVLLGVATAFWVYNAQQRNSDQDEKQKYNFLIQQELSGLRDILKHGEPTTLTCSSSKYHPLITFLQVPILELAAQSGHFSNTDTANLLRIATKVKTYNIEIQFLIAAINSPTNDVARIEYVTRNMETTRKAILNDIDFQSKRMGITLIDIEIKS